MENRKIRTDKGSFKKFTATHADLIRRNIYEMYKNNVIPTIAVLYKKLKNDNIIDCSENTLQKYVQTGRILVGPKTLSLFNLPLSWARRMRTVDYEPPADSYR